MDAWVKKERETKAKLKKEKEEKEAQEKKEVCHSSHGWFAFAKDVTGSRREGKERGIRWTLCVEDEY